MATNLKGAGGIKGFLLLHGEKIAIGLVGVLALWIVYSSLNLPRLDDKHQADALREEITKTSNEVKGFTWDRAVSDHPDKVKKAQVIAAKKDFNVDPKTYVNVSDPNGKATLPFDSAVVAPMIVRTDPVLLNAVEVRATGGSGLLAFVDEEIRKERQLRMATEAAEQAKKDEEKAKKDLQKQQRENVGGPGGARRGKEGPGSEIATEIMDPNHPKRRPIEGSLPPAGIPTQGDERIERAYWACVVAKVPIREQLKLYQDAFEKARGYDVTHDFPHYVGFYVQRAEVVPGRELEWKRVALYDAQQKSIVSNTPLSKAPNHAVGMSVVDKLDIAAAQFWAGGGSQEVVDERFMERALTLRLPPLVGRDWGTDATHPDIPLNPPPLEEEAPPVAAQTPEQQQGTADVNSEFGASNSTMPVGPGLYGAGPGGRGQAEMVGPGGRMPQRRFGPGGGPEGGMGPGGVGPGGMGPGSRRFSGGGPEGGPGGGYRGGAGAGHTAGQHTTLPKGVDYYLLRFMDYTVEPGKKYKYRVQLVMEDPNYNMPTMALSPVVLDRQAQAAKANNGQRSSFRVIETWSDPSPTVGIPLSGGVRLADIKVPSADKFNDEPALGLLVEAFDVDEKGNAIQAAVEEKDYRRGYIANIVKDTEYVGPGYIDTQPGFKFFTGMTVLDVAGGAKLSKDLTVPARVLLMGPSGEVYIRNEVDDKPFVEYHHLMFEKPNDRRRGPGGGPEEGPGGGPGRSRVPSNRAASLPKRG